MDLPSDSTTLESLPSTGRVHVVGAGPVGLLLTALLQSMDGVSVRLYEKRREYTRTRMVQLAPYLMADSVETYRADAIDGDSVEAIFDPSDDQAAPKNTVAVHQISGYVSPDALQKALDKAVGKAWLGNRPEQQPNQTGPEAEKKREAERNRNEKNKEGEKREER